MDAIFSFIAAHAIELRYGARYDFEDVRQACVDNDAHTVDGKIVVVF